MRGVGFDIAESPENGVERGDAGVDLPDERSVSRSFEDEVEGWWRLLGRWREDAGETFADYPFACREPVDGVATIAGENAFGGFER